MLLLGRHEESCNLERFVGVEFFLGRLESEFFLVFFRDKDSIGDLSLGEILYCKGFLSAHTRKGGGKVQFALVFEFEFRLSAYAC